MTKMISTPELAEIVTGLLVAPGATGELEEMDAHQAFVVEIARVVSEFCGGDIAGFRNDEGPGLVAVQWNDSLPDNGGVWAPYDLTGWDEDEVAEPMTEEAAAGRRADISKAVEATAGSINASLGTGLCDDGNDSDEPIFVNSYACPECGETWIDRWSCACDDDCPTCGARDISPQASEEVTDE